MPNDHMGGKERDLLLATFGTMRRFRVDGTSQQEKIMPETLDCGLFQKELMHYMRVSYASMTLEEIEAEIKFGYPFLETRELAQDI